MPLNLFKEPSISSSISHIIGIAAGKGGVGKSSVTVHLASALQHLGFSVGILDADVYGPSLRKMLREDRFPEQREGKMIPALCQGIKMISMAYFRGESEACAIRAPIANGIITQFLKQVEWGNLDFLLIDFPPGTGDVQLTLGQQAKLSGAVMVTMPQEVSLIDVRKAVHLFEQLNIPIIGIVENMSYYLDSAKLKQYVFGTGGGRRLAEELQVSLLGEIPIDPDISAFGDQGKSLFFQKNSDDPLLQIFIQIAHNVLTQLNQTHPFSIKEIKQSESSFTITWTDGKMQHFQLSQLQSHCPCAVCQSSPKNNSSQNLRATHITSVGQYAIKIGFSSGCSLGIYDFELLRKMGQEKEEILSC